MIKKYPWHLVYLIFVVLCLANIFQKLKWSAPTDQILWEHTPEGLVCLQAPEDSSIKKGDLLLTVNKYIINNKTDLNRAILKRKTNIYEIEREGLSKTVGVDIYTRYTPFSYYILVFSGILLILLTLRILNFNLKKKGGFSPPVYFYLLSLSFSGFLIFSPTGSYTLTDFFFLVLDRLCFFFFPALLLHYSLYFPIKLKIVRVINAKLIKLSIYSVPIVILILNLFFVLSGIFDPTPGVLLLSINHFRKISFDYFTFYLILALISFLSSNLWFIFRRKQKRFILPLIGIGISILPMLVLNTLLSAAEKSASVYMNLSPFLLVFLPISLTYYLGHRKFTDIENIIKKTISIASIFLFIFGIFFFLGSTIEQNKLVGIFWSIAAIMTAGLLFRPIEDTVHKFYEKLFFKGAVDFKKKLTKLILSFRNERNLGTIVTNFLQTINEGFQLQKSSFIIHHRKNVFYSLPQKKKILLSKNFRSDLFENDNLVFFSAAEFAKRYPKDYQVIRNMNYFQFLPLKTQDELIGLIAFGPKMDNTYLSAEDWDIMLNIASPLTLSLENASLYSELETQFNEINLLKEFNENIIENINVGIVVLTNLNIIKTWNDFMALKFRIPAAKAIDKKAYNIFGHDLWKQIFKRKQGLSSIHNVKVEINHEELIFDIFISPLKDNLGKVRGTILVFEDVTEKIMIQDQLITAEKMASLGLLSAGIAHEVNTPLTGISSYCQFILDNPEDPANIHMILKIQEQVQRANKIIRTLLNFSRQKGEVPAELDLNKTINESIALVEHTLKKKDITLRREYEFKHKLYGYSIRLQQMFINLLINACDAITDSNGVISISGLETNSSIMIRIRDNGKGIDPRHMKKIFDPFFTTKEKGKGTGLGLSITYTIVQEHYGDITVNSKLNKGTTFIITFPAKSPLRRMKI
ncbi:MAG: GHKL domain-containing protein [Candidatus Aminicenantes bacterium]|nr:MAG: GHKL domain-containing protein [Candidatus Aminicenantes bacterium]